MKIEASDTLIRAARELLRWDQKELAKRAKVGLATLRRFESGSKINPDRVEAILDALRTAGVAFFGPESPEIACREGVALTTAGKPLERKKRPHGPHKKRTARTNVPQA